MDSGHHPHPSPATQSPARLELQVGYGSGRRIAVFVLLIICAMTGCVSGQQPGAVSASVDRLLIPFTEIQHMEDAARSRSEIERVLMAYEQVPVDDEAYAEAQTGMARLYLLLGAAHAQSRREQRHFYQLTQEAAERALLQDSEFHGNIESGQSFATAAQSVSVDDYEPLFLWVTAVFYTFRDVARLPERIFRRNRLLEAAEIIENMINTSPGWNDGALQFSLGIYYLSVPPVMGGDRDKALQLMDEAVSMSDQRLLFRWGRAKYLAVALEDEHMFREDLQWVATRDLDSMSGPMIWNAYFQEDARQLLEAGFPFR